MFRGLRKKNTSKELMNFSFENQSRQVIQALRFHSKT